MVAVPALTAFTFPMLSTVAMEAFDDVHVTSLFTALFGVIVDVKLSVSPAIKVSVLLFKLTAVT